MRPTLIETPLGLDRLATCEEIRAALISFADPDDGYTGEDICEVAADSGGYVRISTPELEAYLLRDELLENQEAWPN